MMPAELPFLVIGLIRGMWSPSSPPFVFAVRPNVANQFECEELSSRQSSAALMLDAKKTRSLESAQETAGSDQTLIHVRAIR
jgi:hypothetical protein